MAFFGKLFKKSPTGSVFGNLLRGAASSATGGILGSGAQLAARNAKEQGVAFDNAVKEQVAQTLSKNTAFQAGGVVGAPYTAKVDAIVNSPQANDLKKSVMMDYLKANWIKILGGLLGIVALVFLIRYFMKKGNKKGGSNGKRLTN